MARRLTIVAVLVLGVIAAVAFWALSNRTDRAERQLGLDAARTLSETFAQTRDLRVATLSGEALARGDDPGFAGLLPSGMTMRYPYSIDYFLDLRRIAPDAYRWDASTKTMSVRLPDVTAAKPNVDAARGERVGTTGVFMSRDAAQRLNAQVAVRASLRAAESAAKREHLDRARESAREAMQALASTPLRAAGLGNVNVVVRFPWEGGGAGAVIPWDESTELNAAYRR